MKAQAKHLPTNTEKSNLSDIPGALHPRQLQIPAIKPRCYTPEHHCLLFKAMLKLIESQLGVRVSMQYLEEHNIPESDRIVAPHHRQLHDLTNITHLSGDASLSQSVQFGGNPLALDEICNLSIIDEQLSSRRVASSSRFFNYSQYKCLRPDELAKAFSTFGEGVLFLVGGAANDAPQLVALLPGTSAMTRRVLRVFTIQSPDMKLKLGQLEARFMPFSREVRIAYEANYILPFTLLHVNFDEPTGGLLSHPSSTTPAHLMTQVSPYSTTHSPLASIKADVDRIKRLSLAYQNEGTWIPLGDLGPASSSASALEQVISSQLRKCNSTEPSLFLIRSYSAIKYSSSSFALAQQEIVTPLGQRLIRELDSTERMWEALKDAPNRRTAREGFLVALRLLQEKADLLSVSLSDFTRFAKLARSSAAAGRGETLGNFEVLGLRMLIEAGVFKATNDCLAVISAVSPPLERSFSSANLTAETDFETRLRLLHHLYRVSCLVVALATVAQNALVEKEIGPLLFDTKSSEAEFATFMKVEEVEMNKVFTHTCTTALKNLTAQLADFTPDLWIMRMSTMEPMQIEKRLVYECINSGGGNLNKKPAGVTGPSTTFCGLGIIAG
ncbi:hypothetical protein EGR_04833 [Echinococcus granulosus]|uniref:Uncharacterized protein n=1 Tax=Echinococcus granulosus TaxID=6210 RepID=W6UFQ2_ECHGR|nr:hypothetical protein EGR_04833 [Echinococcus granulosus]EUB60275.1 hypothetical protein EGR_04833 [Echinococcus granulosus]